MQFSDLLARAADLSPLDRPPYSWEFLPDHGDEIGPQEIQGFDALLVYAARITGETFAGPDTPATVAMFGVGLDGVDMSACTRAGVLVTTSSDEMPRPMAAGAVAFLLALAHNLNGKHQAAREPGWPKRFAATGLGLGRKTLGIVGYGNIGREIAALVQPFDLRLLICNRSMVADLDVEQTDLHTLLREADYVCLCCPLTAETRHLLGAVEIALMKPSAFLINVSRGAVVDEPALVTALSSGQIAGAALDVFEQEPLPVGHPLLSLENVLLAPHAIGYTNELFRRCISSACERIIAVAEGRLPPNLQNPEALRPEANE